MPKIQIDAGGRAPAEVEDYLMKAVRAIGVSQEADFPDPTMQKAYEEERDLFAAIMDAMIADIGTQK